jgi:hypothetical protein
MYFNFSNLLEEILLVLDGVLRRALDGKKRGLTWRLKESLEDTEYADGVCLVYHKYDHAKETG